MSMQTTTASAKLRAAEQRWSRHKKQCSTCLAAARARRWPGLCDHGKVIRSAMLTARGALEESRELDRQPAPGQLPLFDLSTGRAHSCDYRNHHRL